jgi:hypothetical protein
VLFHHDPRTRAALAQAGLAQPTADRAEQRRRHGQVEHANRLAVPIGVQFLQTRSQLRVALQAAEIGLLISDARGKLVPVGILGRAVPGELVDAVAQPLPQGIVAERDPIHSDQRELLGKPLFEEQAEQGGHQLAPGQVATAAENHQHRRLLFGVGGH